MSSFGFDLFSGVSNNTNWFSDWSSIKSGSYKKLLRAYYRNTDSSDPTAASKSGRSSNVLDEILKERRYPVVSEEVQEANSNLTAGISSMNTAVSTLQNEKTYTDTENGTSAADKVASAVKDYVTTYNNVVSTSKKSTLQGKTSHVAAIMESSKQNADKLAEIGVTINPDGTLMLNEKKLKSADISKVQELFSKDNIVSYGSTVRSRLKFAGISSGAVAGTQTDDTEKEEVTYAGAGALKDDITKLTSDDIFKKIEKDGKEQYDVDKIFDAVKNFAGNYNSMLDAAKKSYNSGVTSNLARILEKTEKNEEALKQFGISVDNKGKMTIDEDTFKKADMSKVQEFFQDYGSSIATNVSLVNYYMTTQASTANGYTAVGAYNAQGSFRYDIGI